MTDDSKTTVSAVVLPEDPKQESISLNVDKVYTKDELLLHSTDGDIWLAIDGTVYDLTAFSEEHPGGKKILLSVAGTDASKKYRKYHGDNILQRYAKDFKIGTLKIEEVNVSKGFFSRFKKKQ
ncbi:cytochrome b5-like heme/steroid binding domain-containing protein [Aspergillus cavernicola]|uniref:Cytochrome b5-like heme/steroid binding domain-containing protein n=1 Tax=Aspergillus cavernicola TaxID=176166 RepID=A0ABR4IG21_9EURO